MSESRQTCSAIFCYNICACALVACMLSCFFFFVPTFLHGIGIWGRHVSRLSMPLHGCPRSALRRSKTPGGKNKETRRKRCIRGLFLVLLPFLENPTIVVWSVFGCSSKRLCSHFGQSWLMERSQELFGTG